MSTRHDELADGLYLGLDIGSVNARCAVVDARGKVVYLDGERIYRDAATAVASLVERLPSSLRAAHIAGAGVVGSGRQIYQGQRGWQIYSSPYAAITGLLRDHPQAKTIIEIGGQSALVIGLVDGLERPWRVARSPLCAAGTGRFLEQQASRLGIDIEEFGRKALEWTEPPPRIAARCSVFAKSDLIHLQQKGWPVSGMLAGLSDSVARMVIAQWRDAFEPPVYLIGGVAANDGVVRALSVAIGHEVMVPTDHASREAIGAALLARGSSEPPSCLLPRDTRAASLFYVPSRLSASSSADGWQPPDLDGQVIDAYLGVDVGSTSTKAAVIDASGRVLAKNYLMTAGQPLEAIKQVMANLSPAIEGQVNIRAVGATGSGRYLVGRFIGADLIKNEITSQTRAALHMDPQVDTVFELGGQDSKFIYLENGTPLDYQMNKACAAGTGSFIDELAEQLGISTRTGEFARLAFAADTQLDLGEKCAAFMSQAVTSAQHAGAPLEAIVASLSVSLAKNYHSKVVGTRKVGSHIFLTGAVFYNEAAVAAFRSEFPGRTIVVPEHKEVTGAIGVALLAKESMPPHAASRFRGFSRVAASAYSLSNFTCRYCENNCAISAMTTDDGQKLYYGSRCDRYDASSGPRKGKTITPFTEREGLLFADYDPSVGKGLCVGVPRALMSMDLAPMITTYLNALGVRALYSAPTNKKTIEKSLEHAYTDSCFPVKLLHGHVAELLEQGVDYILIPNAIRMGRMDGDEDQRYSCPLVQAAPYIVASVFGLGERLLDPVIDLSRGDELSLNSFADLAMRMGFSREQGWEAGRQALAEQRAFEIRLTEAGRNVLSQIEADPNAIGVVVLSRAYNAQDAGANLGMAQELQNLGVVPIPLDYLPLDQVDVREVTDRPYWNYERKLLAAAKLVANHPQLFGLFLSNFGCGPNSIIQNVVEDIMGGKPLGQIEIDEHAAEAGYITRLEALVDTVRSYRQANLRLAGEPSHYQRRVASTMRSGECVLIPRMADHAEVVAAAMRAYGVSAEMLPESDERSMALSRDVTNGRECLPFRDTLGVFLRLAADGQLPKKARALMAGSFGPCRLGKYALEQQKIINDLGIDLEIMTTVSNNAYSDLGLGHSFELLAWKAVVAADHLQRLLWSIRPYERYPGETNRAYETYLRRLIRTTTERGDLRRLMQEATAVFRDLRDPSIPRRPRVGINGEIYLRANRFCNKDLVAMCEAHGLEVEVAPMSEWLKYTTLRNLEDALASRQIARIIKGFLRRALLEHYEQAVADWIGERLRH